MFPAAYRRARRLTEGQTGSIWLGHALAILQALLLVALVGVGGLLLALCGSGGTTRLNSQQVAAIQKTGTPRWLHARIPDAPTGDIVLPDTGLYPLVAANRDSRNPLHR